ncbi:hypothetical protein Patl1_25499 [Pistacia atlantica]|uniref:Uncharacterized protein n=1 Tax=Pistacia atlantica TaxID=434234 RepID=A0ACC1AZI4_9ROSI|nr:hypothetical protein Patl1_25499 [Pistacia atlantica]
MKEIMGSFRSRIKISRNFINSEDSQCKEASLVILESDEGRKEKKPKGLSSKGFFKYKKNEPTMLFNPLIIWSPPSPTPSMTRLHCTVSSPVVVSGQIAFTARPHAFHALSLLHHHDPSKNFSIKITSTNLGRKTPPKLSGSCIY